jgi:hypothetical protein
LTSVVQESSPSDAMKANSLNFLVICSMFAKSLKLSSVGFCPSAPSGIKLHPFFPLVLNAHRPRLPSACYGNIATNMFWFSTIGATTRYFPDSGMSIDSIPGNAILRDFWEFSSVKSKMKWSVYVTPSPSGPRIWSYLAYSSSSFIDCFAFSTKFCFVKYIYTIPLKMLCA